MMIELVMLKFGSERVEVVREGKKIEGRRSGIGGAVAAANRLKNVWTALQPPSGGN
jgi:hypothetical protein